jgi:hypothetical protein
MKLPDPRIPFTIALVWIVLGGSIVIFVIGTVIYHILFAH